jgi:ribosomal protein S12 methylthiotransferase
MEVLVDGRSEETDLLLEGRHEGLAPEIDGVVYINDGVADPGSFARVEITEAVGYDLVGHIVH